MLTRREGTLRMGIEALDRQIDELPAGGLHLLSATPGNARTAAVLQFVAAGLEEGERVGLVTRVRPDRLLREAGEYGLSIERPWREGRLVLLGLRGEYEMRQRRAGSPDDVFRELRSLLEPMPARLVFDPGTPLWEGRDGAATASAFVDFLEGSGATALATTTARLEGGLSAATELVVQASTGVFQLEQTAGDLVRLRILEPGSGERSRKDVTLELVSGQGLVDIADRRDHGRDARMPTGPRRTLLLTLGGSLPEELEAWLGDRYDLRDVGDPMELVSRLQEDETCGMVLVQLDRKHVSEARRACRVTRRVRPDLPVVLIASEPLRSRDQTVLLEDGADECFSGNVNVQEFSARLARARAGRGPRPMPAGEPLDRDRPSGPTMLETDEFRDRLRGLLDAESLQVFSVVFFRSADPDTTLEALAATVRSEEGDVVGPVGGGPAVLLPDTRLAEAERFAERAGEQLSGASGGSFEVEIMGSLRDGTELRALVE